MTYANQTRINGEWASPAHIVNHSTLPLAEKRSLLASWASDARAVPNYPSLRRLDDGRLVSVDDVLEALKLLDSLEASPRGRSERNVASFRRGHWSRLSRTWRRGPDDDDDPPPAVAAELPRAPILTGGLAEAA